MAPGVGSGALRSPQKPEGNEQQDRPPHVRPPRFGPVHETDQDGYGSQDDGDEEEQLSRIDARADYVCY